MTSTTYHVTGMTCEHCARAVTAELSALDGVRQVTVALVPGGSSAVTVVTAATPLTAQDIEAALDEAGDYRLAGDGPGEAPAEAGPRASMLPIATGTGGRGQQPGA